MKSKKLLYVLLLLSALMLSACQINTVTEINPDGSGVYKYEFGFSEEDETALAEFGSSIDEFCEDMNEDMPDGTIYYKETRNETETWCVFETGFASLDELREIYSNETDPRINELGFSDGKFTYDLSIDISDEDEADMIDTEVFWIVTMPGRVIENNATDQSGATLTWRLSPGRQVNIRAVSEIGGGPAGGVRVDESELDESGVDDNGFDIGDFGIDFDGSRLGFGIAVVLFLCLCCFVPLVIGGVAFFLIRKKKSSEAPAAASMS
jgi:hypothetical protein